MHRNSGLDAHLTLTSMENPLKPNREYNVEADYIKTNHRGLVITPLPSTWSLPGKSFDLGQQLCHLEWFTNKCVHTGVEHLFNQH
jgi:hypothetical protein